MGKIMPHILALVLAAVLTSRAAAAEIGVTDAWFRALPGELPAAGYFSLHNGNAQPIELVGAKSPACGMLMLHESSENGGMSRMKELHSVTVPAGGSVAFAPGGYHLMCMNPGAAMTPGQTVPVTLIFADGARIDARFAVRNATGK